MRTTPLLLAAALTAGSAAVSGVGGAEAQTPSPGRVGSVPIAAPATALAAGEGHLLVGVGSNLRVIDLSRPASPESVGAYDFEQPVLGLTAVGQAVYVANSHDGLRRLDISDPSAPALTGTSETRGQAVGVAAAGARVFVGDNSLGFDVVDGAGDLERVGEYLSDGFPRGIAAGGPRVFVADQPAGLIVVDVSIPTAPAVIGSLSLGRDPITQVIAPAARSAGAASPVLVCIVSGRGGLQVVDVSDPTAPVVTSPIPSAGPSRRRRDVGAAALCGQRRRAAGIRSDRSRPARACGRVGARRRCGTGGGERGARLRGHPGRGRHLPAAVVGRHGLQSGGHRCSAFAAGRS